MDPSIPRRLQQNPTADDMRRQARQLVLSDIFRVRNSEETTPDVQPPVTATFHWSELPTELKLKVLRHVLVFDKPITPHVHLTRNANRLLPLALTNKEMCVLAMEIYCTKNKFIAQSVGYSKPLAHNFSYPNPMVGHWIQDLTIKLSFSSSHDGTTYGPSNRKVADWLQDVFSSKGQWEFLLDRIATGWKSVSTPASCEWYEKFDLNTLKVIIAMNVEGCFMKYRWVQCSLAHCRTEARRYMRPMFIAAKAKKYEFAV